MARSCTIPAGRAGTGCGQMLAPRTTVGVGLDEPNAKGRLEVQQPITYQFEYETTIPCAFIGAGGHSFRNIYPAFQYAPVDLTAICDLDGGRAAQYARLFGARRSYADHREMLAAERLDAVFIVTGYDADGRVQATDLAKDCLAAGLHVWMEKPTAATAAEVRELMDAARRAERFVMTGLKKIFTPTAEKVKQIIDNDEFGLVSSVSVRYPQALPPVQDRDHTAGWFGFLDHIYHPAALLTYLLGSVERLSYEWFPGNGGSVTSLKFASGAVGTLHLAAGSAATSPLERLEVVGDGANVVVDNGVTLTYYRRGADVAYGRAPSFVVDDAAAPLRWEPEFSLGQLSNKNLFFLGYVPEILHFAESVLTGRPPEKGTLHDSLEIMRLFEAYREASPGETVRVSG